MRGYRFYAEYKSNYAKRKRHPPDNVIAVDLDERQRPYVNGDGTIGCTAAVYDQPDSGVAGVSVSPEYLRLKCRRVSEAVARFIHPRLFAWLDSFQDT